MGASLVASSRWELLRPQRKAGRACDSALHFVAMGEQIHLPPTPDSVAAARRWSAGLVVPVDGPAMADTVALLVSELVSNVVLHARTS